MVAEKDRENRAKSMYWSKYSRLFLLLQPNKILGWWSPPWTLVTSPTFKCRTNLWYLCN